MGDSFHFSQEHISPVLHYSLQGLLSVHDTVAQKDYDTQLPPLPPLHDNKPDEEDSFRIITMIKNQEPLVSPSLTYCQEHFLIQNKENPS